MKIKELKFKKHFNGGKRATIHFANGYGASVITGGISYTNEKQPYEIAILKGDELCYDTPLTSDVIGWQTEKEADGVLNKIELLNS
tara:strand:+ start:213 stop:470 length:258 start_codon:yes stop_codon:yes gene_type:complete